MPFLPVVATAVTTGLAALALTGWMRQTAKTDSALLRSGAHVALAGLGGAGAALLARSGAELFAYAVLGLACALLVVVDLAAYRLPDAILGPSYLAVFAGLAVAAGTGDDWGRLGRAVVAGGVVLVAYFALALISPSGLGLGDVKLSGLLGAGLGWLGWAHTLVGTCAAFVLGGLVAAVLLVGARAPRRSAFPFGPWMVAGAVLGVAYGPVVLSG